MGGRFGRKKPNSLDPNFPPNYDPNFVSMGPGGFGGPPPYPPYGPGYGPNSGLGSYDPYDNYGYDYPMTDTFESFYGGSMRPGPHGGRYGRGMSSPWNYGNFYMGNTTLQMMPYMQRKVAKFGARQSMSMGGMGGMGGMGMPMMPMMPMMPCLPASCGMPMMAAASPLPMACSPLIQGMYPMTGMNFGNWMTPSSFMSALSTAPLPYQPPASFQLPSNIGMIMPFPYAASNPLLSPPTFGGFSPQYNFGGGMSCCCSFCTPCPPPPPAISFYPRPVCVPQPCPVPCPVPVPIPNVQQVPVPRPFSVVAPPIIAGCNPGFPIPSGAPLTSSFGGLTQGGMGQPLVMRSNQNSTTQTLLKDETPARPKRQSIDPARRAKAQRLAASLSNLGLENSFPSDTSSLRGKTRIKSSRKSFQLHFDHDHLTSDSLLSHKRHRRPAHHHDRHALVRRKKP